MYDLVAGCFGLFCITVFFVVGAIIDYKRERYGLVERAYEFRKRVRADRKRLREEKKKNNKKKVIHITVNNF